MVTEIEISEQIRGVEFIDRKHLLVLPANQTSAVIISLDDEEVLEIARSRILRGFTDQECATYGLEPCPTLDEIRRG